MINQELRDIIAESNEDAIVFDNPSFDNSIIGMTMDGQVIYSLRLMAEEMVLEDSCSYDEAIEFICYNSWRAIPYAGEHHPIIMDDDVVFFEAQNNLRHLVNDDIDIMGTSEAGDVPDSTTITEE